MNLQLLGRHAASFLNHREAHARCQTQRRNHGDDRHQQDGGGLKRRGVVSARQRGRRDDGAACLIFFNSIWLYTVGADRVKSSSRSLILRSHCRQALAAGTQQSRDTSTSSIRPPPSFLHLGS
ncbi:hypothetical protein EYF80_032492 [Liparis tanakae]|uniref:Uncharacterized protein n=1 Tax=Liparis tanakae TaxID=230148 RepID=A0A4Z2GX10_9TELE|nr:hypothetical protein EYF80_032492 [Liparis tanakae]